MTLTTQEVARHSIKAFNIQDLAVQLRVSERELRKHLVENGYSSTNIHELRDELAVDYDLSEQQYLNLSNAVELLEEADKKSANHPVRHNQFVYVEPDEPDGPIMLTFWGDWHIGEAGTDHIRLRDDAEILYRLRQEFGKNLTLIGMGDYIGGYMKSKTPSNNAQVLSPSDQRRAAKGIIEVTRPDIVIQGDHDEWHTRQDSEHEWLQEICEDEGLVYAQWGIGFKINTALKNLSPTVLARHRYKGSRTANPFMPQIKLQSEQGPADIVALAHYHSSPGITEQRATRSTEGKFLAVQSGTYKQFDDYGKKIGVGNGEYGVPSLIIVPEEGEIIPFDNLKDAERTMKLISGR